MQHEIKKNEYSPKKTVMIHLHPNWHEFIRQCEKLGYGEIYRLKIQDGLPMTADVIKKRWKFSKNDNNPPS